MKTLAFIFFFVLVFTTCQKSGNGYVRGTVIETGTGLPIEGAKVYVEDTKHGSTHHNSTASAITDANGNYTIKYYKKSTRRYFLYCNDENHYDDYMGLEIDPKKLAVTIDLKPFAYLKIRLKKNSSSLNYVNVRIKDIDINNIYHNYPHSFDTILPTIYKVMGNGDNTIEWFLYYNPIIGPDHTPYNENVYINKEDTLTYMIQFN